MDTCGWRSSSIIYRKMQIGSLGTLSEILSQSPSDSPTRKWRVILPLDKSGPGQQRRFTELIMSGSSVSRTPGGTQWQARVALGSQTSWELGLLPRGTHAVCSVGSIVGVVLPPLVLGCGAGALRTGSCLQFHEEPCEQMPGSPIYYSTALYSWHQNYYISCHTEYIWQYIHCISVITPRLSIIQPRLFVW